jgi:NAD(P)-dependent dehydrogenase (short-subunit alcohol dehydrogenase family)
VEADVLRLFETADREFGTLGALINNAGTIRRLGRVDALDSSALAQDLSTNVGGCFLCAKQAIRRMSIRYGGSGKIVNISSRAATMGIPGEYVHYPQRKARSTR